MYIALKMFEYISIISVVAERGHGGYRNHLKNYHRKSRQVNSIVININPQMHFRPERPFCPNMYISNRFSLHCKQLSLVGVFMHENPENSQMRFLHKILRIVNKFQLFPFGIERWPHNTNR